jgi:hypothetical protein
MATILQPLAPWMRDLSRFMNTPGAASAFLPPADVLVIQLDPLPCLLPHTTRGGPEDRV